MLKIKDLSASIENKKILNKINLSIDKGEFHVIMGTNGTGKSTLANILAGKEQYNVTNGDILFNNESIINISPDERASKGIFMSFQYPISIPGVNTMHFIRTAVNSVNKYKNKEEVSPADFIKSFKKKLNLIGLDESFIKRNVNDGFSGGEKKRFEILQMLMLKPKLVISFQPITFNPFLSLYSICDCEISLPYASNPINWAALHQPPQPIPKSKTLELSELSIIMFKI